MKGTILNQTLETAAMTAEAAVDIVKEVGSEMAGAASGAVMEVYNATMQSGGGRNFTR